MTTWVVGNWKLNPATIEQATSLASSVAEGAKTLANCQIVIAPSHLHLLPVAKAVSQASQANSLSIRNESDDVNAAPNKTSTTTSATLTSATPTSANKETLTAKISIAAQDVCAHTISTGAFTGDTSADQLHDLGVQWVIIGHSERRQYYHESNALLMAKIKHSLHSRLGAILCIGESEAQYLSGDTQTVLEQQLTVLKELVDSKFNITISLLTQGLIIAYEPVWAIGTGKIPSVEEVTTVHQKIRDYLISLDERLQDIPILYGGSVKPDNASEFASSPLIDGVLVGGASLDPNSFLDIAKAFDGNLGVNN